MEVRARYVLMGVFSLAVILGVFAFVYWLEATYGGGIRLLQKGFRKERLRPSFDCKDLL